MNNNSLEIVVEQYLSEKDITKATYVLYSIILKQYILYLKEHKILYARVNDVLNYREEKRNQGYSSRWLYLQINIIKGLYKFLRFNCKRFGLPEVYSIDITESIKNERVDPYISKPVLTLEQAKHLILCTKESRKYIWQYRDHAMVYLMITTGLRSV